VELAQRAERAAREIYPTADRNHALLDVVTILHDGGDEQSAVDAINLIADDLERLTNPTPGRAETQAVIARAWAAVGDTQRCKQAARAAVDTVRQVAAEDQAGSARALSAAAWALAAADTLDIAEEMARSIDTDYHAIRESALENIAQVALSVGDIARAVVIADELELSPKLRRIAQQLAVAGQIDHARRALARSWLTAEWQEPLGDLHLVDMQALRDLAGTPPETFLA
jgi:hypothetical protein